MPRRRFPRLSRVMSFALLSAVATGIFYRMTGLNRRPLPSLIDATVEELGHLLETGETTAVHLTEVYLKRIAEVDHYYHAVIEINQEAVSIARALDQEQSRGSRRGPLHGIPVLIKDNLVTLDTMESTSGSTILLGTRAPFESSVVTKLRAAGAVILGKTNLSEFAGFRNPKAVSGWTPRGGLTMGVFCHNMKASGSSSGSCVATALGLAAFTIGSETDGSIVSPASRSNVVGLKPTLELVSHEGSIPVSLAQDTFGPITRSVRDAALVLNLLADSPPVPDYLDSCTSTDLKGLRVGIPTESIKGADQFLASSFKDGLAMLENAGAILVYNADFSGLQDFNNLSKNENLLHMAGCFKRDLSAYLDSLTVNPRDLKNLSDLIVAMQSDPAEEVSARGAAYFEMAEAIDFNGADFHEAMLRDQYFAGPGGILGVIERHRLDAIAIPGMTGPGVSFAARGGLPLIVVPAGHYPPQTPVKYYDNGPAQTVDIGPNIPVAITFVGPKLSEGTLFKISYALEQMRQAKEKPSAYLSPTCELHLASTRRDGKAKV